jgi:hypothetical protein
VPRILAAVATALVAAISMAGALALAPGTVRPSVGEAAAPVAAPQRMLPSVVLEGNAPRPTQRFALRSGDGTSTVGFARIDWRPRGLNRCAAARVPLGGRGTDVAIHVTTSAPLAGDVQATLYAPHRACDRAVGVWRGTGGDYAGHDGGVIVALRPDGTVRVVLSP